MNKGGIEVSGETVETLVTTLNNIVNMYGQLKGEFEEYRNNIENIISNSSQSPDGDLVIMKFSAKPESKNFRIYPEVLEKLEQIKQKYPSYNTQGIVNTILFKGISKYLDQSDEPEGEG